LRDAALPSGALGGFFLINVYRGFFIDLARFSRHRHQASQGASNAPLGRLRRLQDVDSRPVAALPGLHDRLPGAAYIALKHPRLEGEQLPLFK
jgi:hypothetical protein